MTAQPLPQQTERQPPAQETTKDRRHLTVMRPDMPFYIARYESAVTTHGGSQVTLVLRGKHRLTLSWTATGDEATVWHHPAIKNPHALLQVLLDAQAQCDYQIKRSAETPHERLWRKAVTVVGLEAQRTYRALMARSASTVAALEELTELDAKMEHIRPAYEAVVAAYLAQPTALEQGRAAYDAALAMYRAAK